MHVVPVEGVPAVQPMPPVGPEPKPTPEKKKKEDGQKVGQVAKLTVEMPADAQLFIDDQPTKTASEKRQFRTPTLQPGQAYYYMVRAEMVRDGKKQSETKRVVVRAGEDVKASFFQAEATATAQAK